MGTGRRYTFKDVPGASVTLSFRVPEVASQLLAERIVRAEGISNRTEALQDALVKWIMLEEYAERMNGDREST